MGQSFCPPFQKKKILEELKILGNSFHATFAVFRNLPRNCPSNNFKARIPLLGCHGIQAQKIQGPCPQDSSPLGIPRNGSSSVTIHQTRTEELERRSFVDDVRYKDPGRGAAGKPPSRPPSPPELLLAVLLPPSLLPWSYLLQAVLLPLSFVGRP
jgi:hypothetical protein